MSDLINLSVVFGPVRWLFISVSFVFAAYILYSVLRTHWFKFIVGYAWVEFFTLQPFGHRKAIRRWRRLRQRFAGGRVADCRRAVLDAYAILDDLLDDIVIFFQTITLSQRLEHLGAGTIGNIEELRRVVAETEELRKGNNKLFDPERGLQYLEVYHRAFRDLGVAKD